jgi:hypothetical protein
VETIIESYKTETLREIEGQNAYRLLCFLFIIVFVCGQCTETGLNVCSKVEARYVETPSCTGLTNRGGSSPPGLSSVSQYEARRG